MHNKIYQKIDTLFPEMINIRRYLHQYPELSFKEEKTAQYITKFYDELNIPYEKNVGGNGIIATLKGGKPGKTVALRADFDALPIHDEKEVEYKSKIPGVMHACGHDGHTATLLSLAKAVKGFQDELPGTIKFLHQHAEEEAPGGAKGILESGALQSVDAIFGTHLWSTMPVGTLGISKNSLMAGADQFYITIHGKGGHGGYPHETVDSIMVGSQIMNEIQQIISRRLNPLKNAVITIGQFHAGDAINVIASKAKIGGTVRYFDKDVQDTIILEMERIIKGICMSYDATYEFHYNKGYPPVINHEKEAIHVINGAKTVQEIHTIEDMEPSMAAEDFSYYLLEKPGAFFFTGAQLSEDPYPHHHPKFDFNEKAMPIAAKTLISTYLNFQN